MAASGAARAAARPRSGPGSARKTVCERPEASRRSPRLRSQKENVPDSPRDVPKGPPDVPLAVPASPQRPPLSPCPPSPLSPGPPLRPRRSYSRLEAGTPPARSPRPLPACPPCPPLLPGGHRDDGPDVPEGPVATDLPGIGFGPERKRKRKVPPIDQGELDAWAARMNAQFEEAERFHLVVE